MFMRGLNEYFRSCIGEIFTYYVVPCRFCIQLSLVSLLLKRDGHEADHSLPSNAVVNSSEAKVPVSIGLVEHFELLWSLLPFGWVLTASSIS
jgi:hypothetical protein